ncbi:MAG: succinylglutamate desuccinylase/aspartoacylase family protein [Saezia sp.]
MSVENNNLDESRRNFISKPAKLIPAMALAGAASVMAHAQENSREAAPATNAGDMLQGIPVITELDLDKLEAGKTHRFWFQGASNGASQYWYVPVIVAKGKNPGKRVGIQAVVHGDELNGVKVIQTLMAKLDPQKMSGTVIAAPTVNISGLLANNRNWQHSADNGFTTDFNRIWPGKEDGNVAQQHAYLLFNNLWKGRVDIFFDLHTQSLGTVYPLMLYVDPNSPDAKKMAELVPADQVKNDPEGEEGTVETEFNKSGIPAVTMEIGTAKIYQPDLIERALTGIKNTLSHHKIIDMPITYTSKEANTFFGNEMTSIRAKVGGFADILVKMGDMVTEGQLVAVQRNAFGDIIREYNAPVAGKVLSYGSDPMRESRALLVRLLYN